MAGARVRIPSNAGFLDQRITIQTPTQVQAANGQVTSTWAQLGNPVWAAKRDNPGYERSIGGAETAIADVVFTMRGLAGVTTKCRILHDGDLFDIVYASLVNRKKWLIVGCTQVGA